MNNKIEIVSIILAVVLVLAMIGSAVYRLGSSAFVAIVVIIQLIINIAIAFWIFSKAKLGQNSYPWLWCLLGLAFGLVAVAVYFLIEIHKKVSLLTDKP